MSNAVRNLVQYTLSKFGLQLVRSTTVLSYSLASYFLLLKQLDFCPKHIIDVGANRGKWTEEAMRFFPDAHYTLIEPQDHLKAHVQALIDAGKVSWINAGVGDKSEELPFAIADSDVASTFVVGSHQTRTTRTIKLRTLNEIVSSSNEPSPDMVKIDAEGFDLRVLAGASDLFGKTDIFLVEATLQAGLENTALEVIQRMAAAGYRLMDITEVHRSPKHNVLWTIEIAFLRANSPLTKKISAYE